MLFVAGTTGFVGSHLLKVLKREGIKARCLVRSEEKARIVRSLGFETVIGDITDRDSLKGKLEGIKLIIHLVGIIQEKHGITFKKVHVEGTENLVDEAMSAGVKEFFYQSALGADLNSPFKYLKTKAEAEDLIRLSGIDHWIFRPSLIIGPGDGFTENLKRVLAMGPIVTVPGPGSARFQPLSIDDWTKAFITTIKEKDRKNRIYEFGGPQHLTYNEILTIVMKEMGINKPLIHLPLNLIKPFAPLSIFLQRFTSKIPPVTSEQLDLLQKDSITDIDSMEKLFGFKPEPFEEAVKKAL